MLSSGWMINWCFLLTYLFGCGIKRFWFDLIWMSCSGHPLLYVSLSCPIPVVADMSGWPVLAVLPRLSCPGFPVMTVRSRFVLSQRFLPCPVLPMLSWLICHANLSRLTSPNCPVSTVLSQLSCLAVLSWMSCHGCPVSVVLFQVLSWSGHPVVSFLPRLSFPDCPLQLSCPGCPVPVLVPAVLSRFLSPTLLSLLSCPCCNFPTLLSICPVPDALS